MTKCKTKCKTKCVVLAVFALNMTFAAKPAAPPTGTMQQVISRAVAYEKAGKRAEAAKAYEEIAARDKSKAMVVSHRLVKLYCELKEADKALAWARKIAAIHPDSEAYLAEVYARLGQYDEAKKILLLEIENARDRRRRAVLFWQLADVYEKSGNRTKAEKILKKALKDLKGTPEEKAARKKLEGLAARGKDVIGQ